MSIIYVTEVYLNHSEKRKYSTLIEDQDDEIIKTFYQIRKYKEKDGRSYIIQLVHRKWNCVDV